jgi:hypothetical protein
MDRNRPTQGAKIMLFCFWHVGLILASLWGAGEFLDAVLPEFRNPSTEKAAPAGAAIGAGAGAIVTRTDSGKVLVDGAVGAGRNPMKPAVEPIAPPIEERFTPPMLSRIPYVNRLFRTVGYGGSEDGPFQRIGIDFNDKTPQILPPIKAGACPKCDNPPNETEILFALPAMTNGIPYLYDQYRDEYEFAVEKLVDRVDPPCFLPLIGLAQLHHCHWKCTAYFTETIESSFPISFRIKHRRAEVVYIDRDQIHLCVEPQPVEIPSAPMSCPAGGKAAPKIVAKTEHGEQIQFDVVVTQIDRTAMPRLVFRQAELQSDRLMFGELPNPENLSEVLRALRTAGLAETLSRPNIITLSGRPAWFQVKSERASNIELKMLPTMQRDGTIRLEVDAEFMETNVGNKAVTQKINVVGEVKPGSALAIAGFEGKHAIVVLITPHVLTSAADHSETSEPPVVTPAKVERSNRLTLDDVIALSKRGLSPRIIIRQMEIADAMYDLTVDDLIRLAENEVDEEIISAMQERR